MGPFLQKEAVDPVVPGLPFSIGMDTTAGNYRHIRSGSNVKVIIYQVIHITVGHTGGNIYCLPLSFGINADINSRLVRLCDDVNVRRGAPAGHLAVCPYIVGALRHAVKVRHLFQYSLLYLIHLS